MSIAVLKSTSNRTPVPLDWRATFVTIIEAFAEGNYRLSGVDNRIGEISSAEADYICNYLNSYEYALTKLPSNVWHSSVCEWHGSFWDVSINLKKRTIFLRFNDVNNAFIYSSIWLKWR